jgi:cytochrome P450
MTLVTELDLPAFDYTAPDFSADRYHGQLAQVRAQGWLARSPLAYLVLDREAGEFFRRLRALVGPAFTPRAADRWRPVMRDLLAAEDDGERLSPAECVNLVVNVLAGAIDTTQSQLGHALRLFAAHPGQWEALAADPELEEALRFLAPRMPGLALDGDPELGGVEGIYGVDALPLRWAGAA